MAEDRSFVELMNRLQAGDEEAASEVFHRFAQRLIALARSRLDRLVRQKVDPEDVLQSVYRSFFLRHAQGHFELENWDSLWRMLTVLTLRKCGHRIDYFHAARRDVQREVTPLTDSSVTDTDWQAVAHDPTPSQAALLAETVETLMEGMTDREREILSLSLQGYSTSEISARVTRTERTVQRVLKRVKLLLEEMNAET